MDFEICELKLGGAMQANYGMFLQDLCDLLGVPRPDPNTGDPAQDAHVLEQAVTLKEGGRKQITGRLALYKRSYFILETKQGFTTSVAQASNEALSTAQIAARFRRTKADKVKLIFDTLAIISLVRHLELKDTYAA